MFSWIKRKTGFSRFVGLFDKTREYLPLVAGVALTLAAILGLGTNGHLGFNEPPAEAISPGR